MNGIGALVAVPLLAMAHGPDRAGSEGERMNVTRIAYGEAPEQFGDLWLPADLSGDLPVVVLIHGGFWRATYGLDLMDPLAADLAGRGYAVWNIEYRRVGQDGGGFPGTLEDVAAAVDHLPAVSLAPLDLASVAYVGHSAGGHLAFWAAGRDTIEPGEPGAEPLVVPSVVIGQGPVGDLVEAVRLGAGNGAVVDLMGATPGESPDVYAVANPHIGDGVDVVVLRGELDDIVLPPYTVPAADGDVRVIDVPGEDHFDLIDPASASWAHVIATLAASAN